MQTPIYVIVSMSLDADYDDSDSIIGLTLDKAVAEKALEKIKARMWPNPRRYHYRIIKMQLSETADELADSYGRPI